MKKKSWFNIDGGRVRVTRNGYTIVTDDMQVVRISNGVLERLREKEWERDTMNSRRK